MFISDTYFNNNSQMNFKKLGGKYTPKRSKMVKDAEYLNTKRDLRKKLVKPNTKWSTTKRKIYKKQEGGFIDYNSVQTEDDIELNDLEFDLNPYDHLISQPFKEITYQSPKTPESETSTSEEYEYPNVVPTIEKEEESKEEFKLEEPKVNENISQELDPKYGLMKGFINKASEENLPFRVTSGYRPGAVTSNGSQSWHSKGLALDIVPSQGVTWETFRKAFQNSPALIKWMRDNQFGIINETSPAMLAKTGGTGPHWHIGKDKLAISTFNKMFPLHRKGGILKAEWGDKIFNTYKIQPGQNFSKIAAELGIKENELAEQNNIPDINKIQAGQTLIYQKDPSFIDNVKRFFFETDEDKKQQEKLSNKIDLNIQLSKDRINKKDNTLYKTIFKTKDFKKFAETMVPIYNEVLEELKLPTYNVHNLVRQDALESLYGTKTRGNEYNLGGIKVFTDKEKLGTKHSDGYYYRNFKNLKDYATYKVKLLHNDYGAIECDPSDFINILHGNNPKKKIYSGSKEHYIKSFKNMKSLNKYLI